MSVLELSEESRLLRNAAKGWSAGNVPLEDYRMIRRATLATMLGVDPDEEDTIAGIFDEEPSDVTETIEHIPPSSRSSGKRNVIIIVAAAAVIVIGGAIALLLAG